MPELPEVETIANQLNAKLKGEVIRRVELLSPDVLKSAIPRDFQSLVEGKKVLRVSRRGKLILIDLTGNLTIIIHLKLTGRIVEFKGEQARVSSSTRAVFYFNKMNFFFDDLRKFGSLRLVESAEKKAILSKLGFEPLENSFNREKFFLMLRQQSRKKIKPLLMDQSFIAGIGNIYADEILHFAGVRPDRFIFTLTGEEIEKIFTGIKEVLTEAVKARGTSFRDYVDFSGEKGNYFYQLKVYRREGAPCYSCGQPIKKIRLGGRGTHFCSYCQR